MRVLLVQPGPADGASRYRESPVVGRARHAFNRHSRSRVRFGGGNRLPPFALMVLAALTPPDIEVSIVDEWVDDIDFDRDIDLVGITLLTMAAPRGYEIADRFRERGVKVVLGGIHATAVPDEAQRHADSVVVGEAELVWSRLLADAAAGRLEARYRSDGFSDLRGLPIPRRDLVREDSYVSVNLVQTTRGCTNRCSFCSIHAIAGRKYRARPVDEVIAEIETLPCALALFADDNIVGDPDYAKRLFEAMIPLGIRWTAQATLAIADDEELLDLARRSGCAFLLIGFESLTPEGIRSIGKQRTNSVERYGEAVARIHSRGIGIAGTFVLGLDHDDTDVFARTAEFIQRSCIDVPTAGVLTPYPGSPLFERLRADGRLLHTDWSRYSHVAGRVVYRPAKMTPEELEAGYRWVGERLYSLPAVASRVARADCPRLPLVAWGAQRRKVFRRRGRGAVAFPATAALPDQRPLEDAPESG